MHTPCLLQCWKLPARHYIILIVVALVFPALTQAADDWKYDVLHLKNGSVFRGLLKTETPSEVLFYCVRRHTGSPTVVIRERFRPDEIDKIDRLDPKEHRLLETRLSALDPTGKEEFTRMEHLELKTVPWVVKADSQALSYPSVHFVLLSNAREEIVRRAAVRLEQIYQAYTRYLPPRQPAAQPTTIILVRSLPEYVALLKDQGRGFSNLAFYDAARNRVFCASDLQKLGDELERVRKYHQQQLDMLKEREKDLDKQYKGKIPQRFLNEHHEVRQEIERINRKNDKLFEEITRRLFRTLYHEAFHAYLANSVYPLDTCEVPRWLNEGLAQIFESSLVEAGELRVGNPDPDRLARVRSAVKKGELVALADLLKAGPKQFLVAHATEQQVADRHYLTSWALAFYLNFDRRLLGSPRLDSYVHALKRGADPQEAFRDLVGKPLPEFEKDFQHYLQKLKSDGSVAGEPPRK